MHSFLPTQPTSEDHQLLLNSGKRFSITLGKYQIQYMISLPKMKILASGNHKNTGKYMERFAHLCDF